MAISSYECPKCHAAIPMEDINVSKDVALCRNCGAASSFSEIADCVSGASAGVPERPPKHVAVDRDMMGEGRGTTVRYRKVSPAALFFVPFTAFWSGGSMWGLYGAQWMKHQFNLQTSLLGLPFLIGTVVLVSVCLFMLFGHWSVNLNMGKGTVFAGVGCIGWKRRFVYNRQSAVSVRDECLPNRGCQGMVKVVTPNEKSISFGGGINDEALRYIAGIIAQEARRL